MPGFSYDATIAFAGLTTNDKIEPDSATTGKEVVSPPSPPTATVRVGDYVQWTSNGQDQFPTPKRVSWLSEDGSHARVFGSMTGIPTSELTVTDPPKPPPLGRSASSAYAGSDGELSVLLRGNRLEITADVDRAGIARLKEILGKYEEILALIEPEENALDQPESPTKT